MRVVTLQVYDPRASQRAFQRRAPWSAPSGSSLSSTAVFAQAGADQKKLDPLVGKWRVDLDIKASAAGPGAKVTGTDDCEWFANMHLVCKADAGAYRAMRTISYVPAMKQYAMYTVDSYGYAVFSMGTVAGSTWTFTTEAAGVKYRTVIKTGSGSYTSTADYAGADGKWTVMSVTTAKK